jgi:hypothetical protein
MTHIEFHKYRNKIDTEISAHYYLFLGLFKITSFSTIWTKWVHWVHAVLQMVLAILVALFLFRGSNHKATWKQIFLGCVRVWGCVWGVWERARERERERECVCVYFSEDYIFKKQLRATAGLNLRFI